MIVEALPAALPRLVAVVERAGLAQAPFDPRGILEGAKLFGRRVGLVVEDGEPAIVTRGDLRGIRSAIEVACSLALAGRAVASVDDVLTNLSGGYDPDVWRRLVIDIVDASETFGWIGDACERFAHTHLLDAVSEAVRAALEHAPEAELQDIADALAHDAAVGPRLGVDDLRRLVRRLPGLELIDDRVRRPTPAAPAPDDPPPPPEEASPAFVDLDDEARRAVLVDVLQTRPETTLQELCETDGDVGNWLRRLTIVELALAAVEAGVRRPGDDVRLPVARSHPPTVVVAARVPHRETVASLETEARDHAEPATRSTPALRRARASDWSALSISVGVPSTEARADEVSELAPTDAARESSTLDDAGLLDAIRRGPPYGVSIAELEAALSIPRWRLRTRLHDLEVRGAIVRNGLSRATRYAIPRERAEAAIQDAPSHPASGAR